MEQGANGGAVYFIPDNYVDDGRILHGFVRLRYLVEAAIVGLPLAWIGISLGKTLDSKVFLAILFAGPLAIFALFGFNGDPLSVTCRSMHHWWKSREQKYYNTAATPFFESPVDIIYSSESTRDKLVGAYEDYQNKRIQSRLELLQNMGEEDYNFVADPTVNKYFDPNKVPESSVRQQDVVVILDDEDQDLGSWSLTGQDDHSGSGK